MTIELGFAELQVDDMHFGIVDVPGHERFVRTMVAGATGMDLVMLVVAADDSVMPQTVEHVEILRLLGVRHGVVVVSKIDMTDRELLPFVAEEIGTLLLDTPLADWPVCPVSSVTGEGLDSLRRTLADVARRLEREQRTGPFRMAVDRVFTVAGRGTVLTGSVLSGEVHVGDTLEVFPGGHECRVRDLQSHGTAHGALGYGRRAAINVSGIDRELIDRGSELATPGYLEPSRVLDVEVELLTSLERPLKSATTLRLCMGARESAARIVWLNGDEHSAGAQAFAQLRCGVERTTVYGQRFILRDETASRTLGGGQVLRPISRRRRRHVQMDVEALTRLRDGDELARVEEVLRAAPFARVTELHLSARSGVPVDGLPHAMQQLEASGRWVRLPGTNIEATPSALEDLGLLLDAWLRRHHRAHPDAPGRPADAVLGWLDRVAGRGMGRELFNHYARRGTVKPLGAFVCVPEFAPKLSKADEKLFGAMVDAIRDGVFQPPTTDALCTSLGADRKRVERLTTLAVVMGELVRIDADIYLYTQVESRLREVVIAAIRERGPLTVSELRDVIGSTRKYLVPFVEYLDRVGVTRRVDDRRTLTDSNP